MGGCLSRKSDGRRKTTRSGFWDDTRWETEVRSVTVYTPPPEPLVRLVPPAQPADRVYTFQKPTVVSVPKPKPQPPAPAKEKLVPLYGEYKCGKCKKFWVSRLSWPNRYQQCTRCKSYVRPRNQRELLPTDYTRGKDDIGSEHPQEFCEMCKQLGKYCGKYKSQ